MITQYLTHILRKAKNMLQTITESDYFIFVSQYDNAIFVAYLEESESMLPTITKEDEE